MKPLHSFFLLLVFSLFLPPSSFGSTFTCDTLKEGDAVSDQFAADGILFSHTISPHHDISRREFELPPKSGNTVVRDDDGPFVMDLSPRVTDVGSSPNELLQVVIQGNPSGLSFTPNDLTFTPVTISSVPEPMTLLLFTSGLVALMGQRGKRKGEGRGC